MSILFLFVTVGFRGLFVVCLRLLILFFAVFLDVDFVLLLNLLYFLIIFHLLYLISTLFYLGLFYISLCFSVFLPAFHLCVSLY